MQKKTIIILWLLGIIFITALWQLEIIYIIISNDLVWSYNFGGFGDFGWQPWQWRDFWYIVLFTCFVVACLLAVELPLTPKNTNKNLL